MCVFEAERMARNSALCNNNCNIIDDVPAVRAMARGQVYTFRHGVGLCDCNVPQLNLPCHCNLGKEVAG